MMNLLPTENWEYSGLDIFRGLAAAGRRHQPCDALNLPGLDGCIPARSARAGIVTALHVLGLSNGARVGVPLYCCPVVFKAIAVAGCTPIFIDVDAATCCMSAEDLRAKRSQVDAVIAVHMFGHLCDVPALQEAARDKPIIEDCAQALGSRWEGRVAGSFGAVAAFSFRSGKYLSVGEGGALYSSRPEIRRRIADAVARLPAPSPAQEVTHVARTYLRSKLRSRPLYGLVGYPLWQAYNKRADYSKKSPIDLGQTYRSDLALTRRRLAILDAAIERQRANASFYSRHLALGSEMLCRESPETFYNRYQYPVLFPSSSDRDRVAAYLHQREIGTAKPYKDIAEVARTHYGYEGGCTVAEAIAAKVLVIPNAHTLSQSDIERIAQNVNAAWDGIAGTPTAASCPSLAGSR
jgi:perosamine synthetase